MKIDELKWDGHLISTERSQNCKEVKDGIVSKFFIIFLKTYHNRKDLYNLKDDHTVDFWQSYFETKVPKEKFNIICSY